MSIIRSSGHVRPGRKPAPTGVVSPVPSGPVVVPRTVRASAPITERNYGTVAVTRDEYRAGYRSGAAAAADRARAQRERELFHQGKAVAPSPTISAIVRTYDAPDRLRERRIRKALAAA